MLSREENELLTRVGPGTPCGNLLRRYWHPVAAASELSEERPKKRVKILGEELVLYRDGKGGYGLVAEHCSHRGASLYYGFLEDGCIRCPYHGWMYDGAGRCVEQPFEPNERFKESIRHAAYPVEKLAGLLFAYMGPPEKKPLLPHWDILAWKNGRRTIYRQDTFNCNWFQAAENSADVTHTYFLHARMMQSLARARAAKGQPPPNPIPMRGMIPEGSGGRGWENFGLGRPFAIYGFQPFRWGLLKSWVYEGERGGEGWGNLLIFPNILRITSQIHWRVPVDDTHTEIFIVHFTIGTDDQAAGEADVPVEHMPPQVAPNGEYIIDTFFGQDRMAWETQGVTADRTKENLGASDRGIVLLRKTLREQIAIVEQGGDPMALVWQAAENECIDLEGWENEGDLRAGDSWQGVNVAKKSKQEVFDGRYEEFEVPFGAARPRPGAA